MTKLENCRIYECGNPPAKRGLCNAHYIRFRRRGTYELPPKEYKERTKSPLHMRWVTAKQFGIVPEWENFEVFCLGVGEVPSPIHKLRKKFPGEPMGPENFRWAADKTKAERLLYGREKAAAEYYKKKMNGEAAWTDINRNNYFKKKYGITLSEYNAMSDAQNHACKICRKPETGRRLAVDHCHTTKKIRGLLCSSCNISIGRMSHDPEILHRAIEYLKSADSK